MGPFLFALSACDTILFIWHSSLVSGSLAVQEYLSIINFPRFLSVQRSLLFVRQFVKPIGCAHGTSRRCLFCSLHHHFSILRHFIVLSLNIFLLFLNAQSSFFAGRLTVQQFLKAFQKTRTLPPSYWIHEREGESLAEPSPIRSPILNPGHSYNSVKSFERKSIRKFSS